MTSQNYYLKVMPTVFQNRTATVLSNELSVNEVPRRVEMTPFGQITSLPGIFFIYDITPFMHVVTESRIALGHFLVRVCAVIGGVAAVGADRECYVDRSVYRYGDVLSGKDVLTCLFHQTIQRFQLSFERSESEPEAERLLLRSDFFL